MRYAIIADIHSNGEALRAVLLDIEKRDIKHIMCLGNIIGLGPEPAFCMDTARERCFLSLTGIHEYALLHSKDVHCTEKISRVLDWARKELEAGDANVAAKRWQFLENLPERYDKNGISFVHGSPRDPVDETIFPEDVARNPRKIVESFDYFEKVLFVSHSHIPGIFSQNVQFQRANELNGTFHYRKGEKVMINVGSVGQSRDGDARACYIEINKNHMTWHRVEYDISHVVEQIDAQPALDSIVARRLQEAY